MTNSNSGKMLFSWIKGRSRNSRRGRVAAKAALMTESLEGRQLMAANGFGMSAAALPATASIVQAVNILTADDTGIPGLNEGLGGIGGVGGRGGFGGPGGPGGQAVRGGFGGPGAMMGGPQGGFGFPGGGGPGGRGHRGGFGGPGGFGGDFGAAPATETPESDALSQAMQTLQDDLEAIRGKSQVTVGQLSTLRTDTRQIVKAAGEADETALQTLQDNLEAIRTSEATPTDEQKAQLKADALAVLQSAGVSQELLDKAVADAEAIATASQVTAEDIAKIQADQQAIKDLIDAKKAADAETADSAASETSATPLQASPQSIRSSAGFGRRFGNGPRFR